MRGVSERHCYNTPSDIRTSKVHKYTFVYMYHNNASVDPVLPWWVGHPSCERWIYVQCQSITLGWIIELCNYVDYDHTKTVPSCLACTCIVLG